MHIPLKSKLMVMYLLTLHVSIVDPSTQRSGWSSLVVTQPSTGHQLLCVQCVSVCVYYFVWYLIAVRLDNKAIFSPAITVDVIGHSKFCNVSQLVYTIAT